MAERRVLYLIGALWGMAGVALLLGAAIYRLAPLAMEALASGFRWYHWFVLAAVLVFMGYAEGYRAFQRGFSPRVSARARYLSTHPNALYAVFAPLFCMAYFHAPRRRRIVSLSVTGGIIVLIVLVLPTVAGHRRCRCSCRPGLGADLPHGVRRQSLCLGRLSLPSGGPRTG